MSCIGLSLSSLPCFSFKLKYHSAVGAEPDTQLSFLFNNVHWHQACKSVVDHHHGAVVFFVLSHTNGAQLVLNVLCWIRCFHSISFFAHWNDIAVADDQCGSKWVATNVEANNDFPFDHGITRSSAVDQHSSTHPWNGAWTYCYNIFSSPSVGWIGLYRLCQPNQERVDQHWLCTIGQCLFRQQLGCDWISKWMHPNYHQGNRHLHWCDQGIGYKVWCLDCTTMVKDDMLCC